MALFWKKFSWIIELIIITCLFGIILKYANLIALNNNNYLLGGFAINVLACTAFLVFALFKLIITSKEKKHSFASYFKKKLVLKDIWIVLGLFIIGGLFYRLIMKLEIVHFFNVRSLHAYNQPTSVQCLPILSLIVLFIPIVAFSEELYFRCYLFELQFNQFKNYTWIINGFSWSIYHLFTPTNFLALLPTCLMFSYVYQKRRNVWITIAAHLFNNFFALYPLLKSFL